MKPVLQALLLADHVYEDAITHKKVIAGTFNTLGYTKQSLVRQWVDDGGETHHTIHGGMQSGSPWSFISLTDVLGDNTFQLRYVDLQDNSILLETQFRITSKDRFDTSEIAIPMPLLPVPHPGVYALELHHKSEMLGSLRINVREITHADDKQGNN